MLQRHPYTLHVTRSALDELQTLAQHASSQKQEALLQARQWGLDECNVIIEPRDIPKDNDAVFNSELGTPGQDICKLVSHSHFLVATQDEILLDTLRKMGVCPLLRLSRSVLLLENPSKAAQQKANRQERSKYAAHEDERLLARHVVEEQRKQQANPIVGGSSGTRIPHKRIKSKAKGPNPLSCKPSKRKTQEESSDAQKRKRRRKHKDSATQE